MAKYPFIVNKDGIWYPAGAEVPVGVLPFTEEGEDTKEREYTKTEINRMSVDDLRLLASKLEIADAESKNGAGLKKAIIGVLNL